MNRLDAVKERLLQAPVTGVLLAVNVLIFLLETIAGGSNRTSVALMFGAQYTPLLIQGQLVRLVSSMFLHFGLMHLLCNMFSLFMLGPAIERIYGRVPFILIYLCGGLCGNLLTWFVEQHRDPETWAVSAGASGAIFALFGAYIALAILPSMRERISFRGIVITLVLNLAYGLTYAGINMIAHAGGLVGGIIIGGIFVFVLTGRARMKNKES